MLRDWPKMILLTFTGLFLVVFIFYYSSQNYINNTNVKSIQDALRTTALSNRDDSARVNRGTFILKKENFQKDFKKVFDENHSLTNPKYTFDYLDDGNGGIKAIKVKVSDDNNKKYQATCILNVAD